MRVFFTHMHITLGASLALMLRRAGFAVYTPDEEFTGAIRGPYQNSNALHIAGATQISAEEFLDTPMDAAILMCQEQERGSWWELVADQKPDMTVVHYAGNEWVPYQRSVNHLLYTNNNVLTHLTPRIQEQRIYPILPYEAYQPPLKDRAELAQPVVRSFISDIKNWKRGYPDFCRLQALARAQLPAVKIENHEFRWGQPRDEVSKLMHTALLGAHFKDSEGYGFSVLEMMCQGVPVIVPNYLFSRHVPVSEFVVNGLTGWVVTNTVEAMSVIDKCYGDREYLQKYGDAAAERVRMIIDEEEQVANLKQFMEKAVHYGSQT